MKLKLVIEIDGETQGDLIDAVEEVHNWLERDMQSGFGSCGTGGYRFEIKETTD